MERFSFFFSFRVYLVYVNPFSFPDFFIFLPGLFSHLQYPSHITLPSLRLNTHIQIRKIQIAPPWKLLRSRCTTPSILWFTQAPSSLEADALALYNAINPVVMAKFESGEFTTEEEANAFGNKITAAFALACKHALESSFLSDCEDADEAGFPEYFKYSLDVDGVWISYIEADALALYDAINPVVMAKFESGEFATEEEANAFGNKITAAFASACDDCGEDDFPEVFKAKLDDSSTQAPSSMEAAALALYDAINNVVVDKCVSEEFKTEEEANAFGNKITVAFAAACDVCGEDDFSEVFKAKLRESC